MLGKFSTITTDRLFRINLKSIFSSSTHFHTSASSGITKTSSNSLRGSRKYSPHGISTQSREIIQFCFENPHSEIGSRVCNRIIDKRTDFKRFGAKLGKDKWIWFTGLLRKYLEDIVQNIESTEKIEELSRNYGKKHVALRNYGFKPDFWVSLADAIITECIILDLATHQPADTVAAWSQLVSIMFTSVRDGYYASLRDHRKASKKSLSTQSTMDLTAATEFDKDAADSKTETGSL
ncbi:unnamed protein product [Enterobius vermicularis]|uniref:GLOBIN domain-containing protein n=1 Tax=Enterobius vermicularis TaxID=51028 RepID=A0A0N4VPJ7_ENTVE|nr:unnamed protein product [Enterobius vermicularis]